MSTIPPSTPPANAPVLYTFAAKGIQGFVLGSDEMRDMAGATELVEQLPNELLDTAIRSLGLAGKCQKLSAAAGQARVKFDRAEDARALAAVWPMACAHLAPGLEIAQAIVPITDGDYLGAVKEAERTLIIERNCPRAILPEITPVVARNPRSGLPAVETEPDPDNHKKRVPVDAQSRMKRRFRKEAKMAVFLNLGLDKSSPDWAEWHEPQTLEDISGDDRSYLAVVHADGNGLGQMFIRLANELGGKPRSEPFYRELSHEIAQASARAAAAAVKKVKDRFLPKLKGKDDPDAPKVWPLLPIVLAGDDLTLIIRADLAIDFTKTFLTEFEKATQDAFARLKQNHNSLNPPLLDCLTAGAGIAFVKRRYPFSSAYALCESLAKYAKKTAKEKAKDPAGIERQAPSTLAFHRVSASSTSEEFDDLLNGDLRGALIAADEAKGAGKHVTLSMAPYVVQATGTTNLKPLKDLETLTDACANLPQGQVRELLALLETNAAAAIKHFERIKATQGENGKAFAKAMDALVSNGTKPFAGTEHNRLEGHSPLGDALTWAYFKERGRKFDPPKAPAKTAKEVATT